MLNSNALHISLTAEEYLEAITPICGETEYTPEGYPIAYWETDEKILPVYKGLREKAGWTEEDRITIMMNEPGIEAEAFGTGTGFCINDKKLYYGELEDGLPNGEGIIYSFFHGYPEYGTGFWEDGYIEGTGYFCWVLYGDSDEELCIIANRYSEGNYSKGQADGKIQLRFEEINGPSATVEYEVLEGHVILDS